jgi:hypothetical protein
VSHRPWTKTMAGFRAAGTASGVSVVIGLRSGEGASLTREITAATATLN